MYVPSYNSNLKGHDRLSSSHHTPFIKGNVLIVISAISLGQRNNQDGKAVANTRKTREFKSSSKVEMERGGLATNHMPSGH